MDYCPVYRFHKQLLMNYTAAEQMGINKELFV